MGMPALRHHWSADQVRALIEESPTHWPRYELLAGELIVTPAPGGIHQVAVAKFLALFAGFLTREPVGVALTSPADLQLHPNTIAQPDIFVVPRVEPSETAHIFSWADISSLLLALEVISPSSGRTDRVEKRDYYMSARVPEYWVVDLDARVVERWNPERLTPVVARNTLGWRPAGASEPLTVNLPDLFEQIWSDYRAIGG
jgi:Uma2 family endonuclease